MKPQLGNAVRLDPKAQAFAENYMRAPGQRVPGNPKNVDWDATKPQSYRNSYGDAEVVAAPLQLAVTPPTWPQQKMMTPQEYVHTELLGGYGGPTIGAPQGGKPQKGAAHPLAADPTPFTTAAGIGGPDNRLPGGQPMGSPLVDPSGFDLNSPPVPYQLPMAPVSDMNVGRVQTLGSPADAQLPKPQRRQGPPPDGRRGKSAAAPMPDRNTLAAR